MQPSRRSSVILELSATCDESPKFSCDLATDLRSRDPFDATWHQNSASSETEGRHQNRKEFVAISEAHTEKRMSSVLSDKALVGKSDTPSAGIKRVHIGHSRTEHSAAAVSKAIASQAER